MVLIAAATVAGAPVTMPDVLRAPVLVVLGISIGSGVTPEALTAATTWPLSLVALAVAVPAMMVASAVVLTRTPGWDKRTAWLAAAPGALSYVLALAVETGADARRVAIVQTLRLVVLVLVLPSVIIAINGTGMPVLRPVEEVAWLDLGLLAAGCWGAGYVCQRIGVPAGLLFGPMLISAAAHGYGLTDARVPVPLLNVAMLLMGGLIGARFAGVDWPLFRSTMLSGLVNLLIATAIAAVFAALVTATLDIPFGQVLLAFAPGGAEAMAILAFMLDLDPAYVAVHHVARFLGLGVVLPVLLRASGVIERGGRAHP